MSVLARLLTTLTVEGPVLSAATLPGTPGLDSAALRDRRNRPILPFSLVQGCLRQAWSEVGHVIGVDRPRLSELLGEEVGSGSWEPARGRLMFSDFAAPGPGSDRVDVSVRLDALRGAAVEGALRHIEMPFLPGAQVPFTGEIRFLATSDSQAREIARQVELGLRWVSGLGGERTVGFGHLLGVCADLRLEALPASALERRGTGSWLPLELRFDSPFCLSGRPEGGNLFESAEVVSGAAIKGTLARMLQELFGLPSAAVIDGSLPSPMTELGRSFDRLRFTHAFPATPGTERPNVVPQSVVRVGERRRDVALCRGPVLIDGRAPAFAVDWKDVGPIRREFGWPRVSRELRLRTAIDRARRRAEDEKLFAYEMVQPTDLVWLSAVDLADVHESERPEVRAQLTALLRLGLQGVGKTGAEASVRILPTETAEPSPRSLVDGGCERVWVIALQTPALLADPKSIGEEGGEKELRNAYVATWDELSQGELTLRRHFTVEKLVGGYLTERFRRRRTGAAEKAYRPYLLSEAGSVFVLAAAGAADPGDLLASWRDHGLPLPRWAVERYGEDWRTCPFTRQDGFGEIAVNLPCHKLPRHAEDVS